MKREILFNAFVMNCVAHQSPGLWRHPQDRSVEYTSLSHWTELARLLERGRFDAMFIADVLGCKGAYRAGTLRHKMFGRGARLQPPHPGGENLSTGPLKKDERAA